MKCIKGYEITACRSAAGWYMGTVDEDGCPNCRLTTQYARSAEEAEQLPLDRQCGCMENEWCNGGKGCFA